jgi:hypothetical protein
VVDTVTSDSLTPVSATVCVVANPALTLTKTASPVHTTIGATVHYTITLANTGQADGHVDSVTDTYDINHVGGISNITSGGSPDGSDNGAGTITWNKAGGYAVTVGSSIKFEYDGVMIGNFSGSPGSPGDNPCVAANNEFPVIDTAVTSPVTNTAQATTCVAKLTPAMSTSATPTTTITAGSTVTAGDSATLVPPAGGPRPTGQVTFTLFSNSSCTTVASPALSGNGTIPATGAVTATFAGSWTPTTVGTYTWKASYPGDGSYLPVTLCGGPNETLTVGKASPTFTTTASPATGTVGVNIPTLRDTANFTGGSNPTGTVTFTLFANSTCTTPATPSVTGTGTVSANSATFAASFTPATAGTYTWQAVYSGDANNNGLTICGGPNEQVVVAKATPNFTTLASPATATAGVTITAGDTATLTQPAGGARPTGTVTFTLYSDAACTTPASPALSGTGTIPASGAISATFSGSWKPTTAGTYTWKAVYNGDVNYNSKTQCGGTNEQIVVGKASPTITTQASPTTGQATVAITPVSDSATFSSTGAAAPTGSVTFTLYSDANCTVSTGVTGSGAISTSGGVSTATYSQNFTPPTAGTYQWKAVYAGDANNNGFTTACGAANEQLVVAAPCPTGTVTINKSIAPNPLSIAVTFNFTVTGPGFSTTASVTVPAGQSSASKDVPVSGGTGPFTLHETGNDHPELGLANAPDAQVTLSEPNCKEAVSLTNSFGPASIRVIKTEQFKGSTTHALASGHWTFTLTGPGGFTSTQKTGTNEPITGGPNVTVTCLNENGSPVPNGTCKNAITWSNLEPGSYKLCEAFFISSWVPSFTGTPNPVTLQPRGASDAFCVTFTVASSQLETINDNNVCTQTQSTATIPRGR